MICREAKTRSYLMGIRNCSYVFNGEDRLCKLCRAANYIMLHMIQEWSPLSRSTELKTQCAVLHMEELVKHLWQVGRTREQQRLCIVRTGTTDKGRRKHEGSSNVMAMAGVCLHGGCRRCIKT